MAATVRKLRHAHGCTGCHDRYDDTCAAPQENGLCPECQGFLGWGLLILNRLPKDCCRTHARSASKNERALYQLSKACPWWICPVCARTFPFANPHGEPS